jgi:DMSO/TMAO reductase YedYZ molybdopterin-dependent catalytic subunit
MLCDVPVVASLRISEDPRHAAFVRVTHWITALCFLALLITGVDDLPVGFGGPLRLRVPRQLGYKSVKFITRVTVTDSLKGFGKGLGGVNAEGGYSWYAGI